MKNQNLTFHFDFPSSPLIILPENTVFIGHIHSHMQENTKKRKMHLEENIKKYKQFTKAIIEGNKLADNIASKLLPICPRNNPSPRHTGNDIWQLINRKNDTDSPIYDTVKNYILTILSSREHLKIAIEAATFSQRLLHKEVSASLSTYIFKNSQTKTLIPS